MKTWLTIFLLLTAWLLQAATNNLADCQFATVGTAISNAAAGDTIVLPVGTATWPSPISITVSITVRGQGIGQTVITATPDESCLNMYAASRITQIEFQGVRGVDSTDNFLLIRRGLGYRVDRCKFITTSGSDKKLTAYILKMNEESPQPTGLFDYCTIINSRILSNGAYYTTGAYGTFATWFSATTLGTTNCLCIENCTFSLDESGNNIDVSRATRLIARFNTFTNGQIHVHAMTSDRGTRQFEIYNNTFKTGLGINDAFIFIRAGTGVCYSNTTDNPSGFIKLDQGRTTLSPLADGSTWLEDSNDAIAVNGTGTHDGVGGNTLIDSTQDWGTELETPIMKYVYNMTTGGGSNNFGQVSAYTGTTITVTNVTGSIAWTAGDTYKITGGYASRDQIGRGKDSALGNTTYYAAQALEPAYFWNNYGTGGLLTMYVPPGQNAFLIQLNRDYYESAKPGYTPLVYPHPLASIEDYATHFAAQHLRVLDSHKTVAIDRR